MNRKLLITLLVPLAVLTAACGSETLGTAPVPEAVDEFTEAQSDGVPVDQSAASPDGERFDVAGGLTCASEESEHSILEYAEDAIGSASIEVAVRLWWRDDPAAKRWDRSNLTEALQQSAVTYADTEGHVILNLGFFDSGNGWLLGTRIACAS